MHHIQYTTQVFRVVSVLCAHFPHIHIHSANAIRWKRARAQFNEEKKGKLTSRTNINDETKQKKSITVAEFVIQCWIQTTAIYLKTKKWTTTFALQWYLFYLMMSCHFDYDYYYYHHKKEHWQQTTMISVTAYWLEIFKLSLFMWNEISKCLAATKMQTRYATWECGLLISFCVFVHVSTHKHTHCITNSLIFCVYIRIMKMHAIFAIKQHRWKTSTIRLHNDIWIFVFGLKAKSVCLLIRMYLRRFRVNFVMSIGWPQHV